MIDKDDINSRLDVYDFYSAFAGLPENINSDEVSILCPFHDDSNPSCYINLETGFFYCQSCNAGGDMFTFYALLHELDINTDFAQILRELDKWINEHNSKEKPIFKRTDSEDISSVIEAGIIMQWHNELLANTEKLRWLQQNRGLTLDTIRTYLLGFDGGRYTIPVKNDSNEFVNVRRYLPGGSPKFLNYKRGYGTTRLYPSSIEGTTVFLFEGELDTLLARQLGFPAYCYTSGATSLPITFEYDIQGKRLVLCYDIDSAGLSGAISAAQRSYGLAKSTQNVRLPITTPKNGDFTDYIVTHGYTARDMQALVKTIPEYLDGSQLNLDDVIPPHGFIKDYIKYASQVTDAPREFHLAVGLTVLSLAVGNRIHIKTWGRDLYPNMWSILISPSGFYHKSTAMNIGLNMVRALDPGLVYPDDFSKEALIDSIGSHPVGVLPADEFGAFIEKMNSGYNQGAKEMLTQLHDQSWYTKTRRRIEDSITIEGACLSILAGSTVEWMFRSTTDGDVRGGFLPRFLFWPFFTKDTRKGFTGGQNQGSTANLLETLRNLRQLQGEMFLPITQAGIYDNWLRGHEDEFENNNLSSDLQGFYARFSAYVLKIAMLYQISMSDGQYVIGPTALKYAIRLVEMLKSRLISFVQNELTVTKEGNEIRRIKRIIAQYPDGIKYPQLLAAAGLKTMTLQGLLDTLLESKQINVKKGHTKGGDTYVISE